MNVEQLKTGLAELTENLKTEKELGDKAKEEIVEAASTTRRAINDAIDTLIESISQHFEDRSHAHGAMVGEKIVAE